MENELPCAVNGCPAIATPDGFCAVHTGLRKEAYDQTRRSCGKRIAAGKWHRRDLDGCKHFPACPQQPGAKVAAPDTTEAR